MATWETVCAILAELPGTEPTPPGHHLEGVRVRGKQVAYLPGNARSRPEGVTAAAEYAVIRIDYGERWSASSTRATSTGVARIGP